MKTIVLTGGPCAGKTTIMSHLIQSLEDRGYRVFVIPETPTELILNGIFPCEDILSDEFQKFVLDKQLMKENLYCKLDDYFNGKKAVILCDRGILDALAYIDKGKFLELLKDRQIYGLSDVWARYDGVIHMVTAANGAESYYQWNDPNSEDSGNNTARRESPEEARQKDSETINAWTGHPHLRVIDNSTDFSGKIKRVTEEVFSLLGEPIPTEIERKFLIKKPTLDQIAAMGCISEIKIVQTYLNRSDPDVERRIRQRGSKDDGYTFYYTEKKDISDGERIEKERAITHREYIDLITDADTSLHQISKTRYCFIYGDKNLYYELDVYPFSDEYAILEIELKDIHDDIDLPPFEIVKEVTNDKNYRNYEIAKTLTL